MTVTQQPTCLIIHVRSSRVRTQNMRGTASASRLNRDPSDPET